jgi:predicted transcriptional regulator
MNTLLWGVLHGKRITMTRTIELSDELYHRLQAQAGRLNLSPEQVLEQLLLDAAVTMGDADETGEAVPAAGAPEALAAVQRLTTLFADLPLPDVEAVLSDPALALANVDLTDLPQ